MERIGRGHPSPKMERNLFFIAAVALTVVAGCGGHKDSVTKPVTGKEWHAVLADWTADGRFTQTHSCAAVVVARTSVVPFRGTPLITAIDDYERTHCPQRGKLHSVKIGMSDRDVVEIAGTPVGRVSGPHCWAYLGNSRKLWDGVSVCFSHTGHVSAIAWATHG
jgi:hypothetical protein